MLWVPQKGIVRVEHNATSVGSLTWGSLVTTGATSSVMGATSVLIASTSFDAYWVEVIAHQYGAGASSGQGALDILTGTTTEEVLIPNLLMGNCGGNLGTSNVGPKSWQFPLYIPAGSRLTARACGQRLSTNFYVAIFLWGGSGVPAFRVGSKVTTYGITTLPGGTTIVPGASGAEGAWTQLTASTTEDHFAFCPSFQSSDGTMSQKELNFELGVGAATEEALLGGNAYIFRSGANETMEGPWPAMPAFQDVPSGSRITARVSCSGTIDSPYSAAVHAVS